MRLLLKNLEGRVIKMNLSFDEVMDYKKQIAELQADKDRLQSIIDKGIEQIKSLNAYIRHDAKVCDDYDDGLIKECKELQAENDRLNADNKRLYQEHKECRSNG